MRDPNRWQPLALAQIVAQNGLPVPGKVQTFIGPHWGHVSSFAPPGFVDGVPIDPGPPPHLGNPRVDEAVQADGARRHPVLAATSIPATG